MGFYKNINAEVQSLPIRPNHITPHKGTILIEKDYTLKVGEMYSVQQDLIDKAKDVYDGYLSQHYRRRYTRIDKRLESTSRVLKAVPAEDTGFVLGQGLKCNKCVFYHTCLCDAIDCYHDKELVIIDVGDPDREYSPHDVDGEKKK